ncbi:hypothetical protein [Flagellimonas sp. 2504JD1-5]
MGIFEKNNSVYTIIIKLADVFRPVFDKRNSQTVVQNRWEKNLKPNLVKIKK